MNCPRANTSAGVFKRAGRPDEGDLCMAFRFRMRFLRSAKFTPKSPINLHFTNQVHSSLRQIGLDHIPTGPEPPAIRPDSSRIVIVFQRRLVAPGLVHQRSFSSALTDPHISITGLPHQAEYISQLFARPDANLVDFIATRIALVEPGITLDVGDPTKKLIRRSI